MTWNRIGTTFTFMLLIASATWAGPEPWSDKRCPQTEGLVLWLDAGKQNDARQALGQPAVLDQQPLDAWFDASGHGLHLTQPSRDAQPRFENLKGGTAIRFDGQDDFLFLAGLKQEFRSATVFIVAAPMSNAGSFRGLLAGSTLGRNDYTHGFTIDLGPFGSPGWQWLNVEGAGFGGAGNLITQPIDFGSLHQLSTVIDTGNGGVRLFVDGQKAGQRNRTAGAFGCDQVFIGARYYSNEARPPFVQGFLDGLIGEVLIYDRVLSDEQRKGVEKYLAEKYAGVTLASGGKRLVTVKNPPAVQMLVPGFRVKQLPLDLPNINNVRYRADGKLVALAYDGDVYLLSDSDGDGVEDKAIKFWDNQGRLRSPIGMALTPPDYKHGNGLFVAGKGKLSLIADTDGDDKADKETVVASGWKELPHGVDALGVAVDKDGSVLFGLGAADFTNAYQIDKSGKAQYDLKSERGTIMRVSPDFSKREVVATGIRFPVALAFHRDGDLFASDQEGATWLPNGNPLDELLHVQPGRHYGFPPRHPKHLPDVTDEPSTFDYAPQHQSVCGLIFNESVNGGPVFGPEAWKGDALLSGYSRGKLYRTQLVKTSAGYVARNQLLARLNMLTVDSCVSPKGELIIAVHSGPPDWGTGPTGKGKLYQVSFDPQTPQPVAAWAASPREVRIAFDQPLQPEHLNNLAKRVQIEGGPYAGPGDRFEVLRPPYAVVQQQLATPRQDVAVLAAAVSPDRRTLVLTTSPHPEAFPYAVTLPGLGRPEKPAAGELPQHAALDVGYDLHGVAVSWQSRSGSESWSGWLPHLDLNVSQALTRGSAEHDALWPKVREPGRLTLKTQLDLWQMLRPTVQPGSTLDHIWPPEQVTVTLTSSVPVEFKTPAKTETLTDNKKNHILRLRMEPKQGQPVPLEFSLPTGEPLPLLEVSFTTNEDTRPRPLALHRLLLPWATLKPAAMTSQPRTIPELEGGSWVRGRAVFFSDQAGCAKCHIVRGAGGKVGPDLSNLVHRDYESVLRDVRSPSAALNPDFLNNVVELANGRVVTGLVSDAKDKLIITDSSGQDIPVLKADIDTIRPASLSLMPEGLDKTLGPEKLRDLLTFLLTEPLTAAPLEIPGAPPPRRSRAHV